MNRWLLVPLFAAALASGCARKEGAVAPAASAPATEAPPPVSAPEAALPGAPPAALSSGDSATAPGEVTAECDAEAAQQYIGQVYTPELGEEARLATHARVQRALRPGQIVTMEFLADRLSVTLDESGRISAANCG